MCVYKTTGTQIKNKYCKAYTSINFIASMWEMDRKRQFKMITAHLENLFLVNREVTHSTLIVLLIFLPFLQEYFTVSCSLWTCVLEYSVLC